MGVISELAGVMGVNERLRFDLQRGEDGKLTIVVQPYLSRPVEDLNEEEAQLRAALAMPLRVTGEVAALDANLAERLREFGSRRGAVAEQVAALDALKEAGKAGQRMQATRSEGGQPATEKPAKRAKAAKPETAIAETPAPTAQTTPGNPDSLF